MFQNSLCILIAACLLLSCTPKPKAKTPGIVVLSPEVAEIICALGAEDQITGLSSECDYPASLSAKPKVGNFSTIDKEAIIALNPQIVFCSALEQEGIAAELKKLGMQVEIVYPKSIATMLQEIVRIGGLIGKEEQAEKLTADYRIALQQIMATNSKNQRPKVYLEIYRDPLMSVSDASLVGELIDAAGGDNIFPTLERDYARVNPEAVISAKPDIMICFSRDSRPNICARKGWQNIPAVVSRRIYFETDINPDIIQRATPRSIEGIRQMQALFSAWASTQ